MTDRRDHDPFAPHYSVPLTEVEPARESFVERLRQLGAEPDVLESVAANWDDPEWTERDQVVALSDEALRAELAAIEAEHAEHTTTEDEAAEQQRLALEQAAAEIVHENAAVVIAWVNDDDQPPARANAIEALEAKATRPRKTVLEACAAAIEAEG